MKELGPVLGKPKKCTRTSLQGLDFSTFYQHKREMRFWPNGHEEFKEKALQATRDPSTASLRGDGIGKNSTADSKTKGQPAKPSLQSSAAALSATPCGQRAGYSIFTLKNRTSILQDFLSLINSFSKQFYEEVKSFLS